MSKSLKATIPLLILLFAATAEASFASLSEMIQRLTLGTLYDSNGNPLPVGTDPNSPQVGWKLVNDLTPESAMFKSIGQFRYDIGDNRVALCSATFIDANGSDDSPAYALSAGHCFQRPLLPNEYAADEPAPPNAVLRLNDFVTSQPVEFPVTQIAYATEHASDVLIMKLGVSVAQVKEAGFTPIKISNELPQEGDPIVMAGVPSEKMANASIRLHSENCEVASLEDESETITNASTKSPYTLRPAIRYTCSTVGGDSGSPLISQNSHEIVGVVHGEPAVGTNSNIATRVTDIPGCFDARGIFDLTLQTCHLPN